jgi:hypothetical protein
MVPPARVGPKQATADYAIDIGGGRQPDLIM